MPTPRKPAAVKRLTGNPGGRPILPEPEPERLVNLPRCPSWVMGEGRRAWRSLGADLLKLELLTGADLPALALLAAAWGRWADAEGHCKREGQVIVTASGELKTSPWAVAARNALDEVCALLREFGGTPASRSRVALAGKAGDPIADLRAVLLGDAPTTARPDDSAALLAELQGHDDKTSE